jgi:hypothetical protein
MIACTGTGILLRRLVAAVPHEVLHLSGLTRSVLALVGAAILFCQRDATHVSLVCLFITVLNRCAVLEQFVEIAWAD